MSRKPRSRWDKFWTGVLKTLYNYRSWWVDVPTISLLGLFHWHFYSHGVHAVPEGMPEFSWIVLGMYLLVKEGVRWILHGIQSRRGSILVAVWLLSCLEFFFMIAKNPACYSMPSKMIESTLIVLGGFLGIIPAKRLFSKKYPIVGKALLPHDE